MSQYQPGQPGYPHQPEYGYRPAQPEPKNGFGLAALITGLCGAAFGLLPITFWIAAPLALTAIVLAAAQFGRIRRGTANNPLVTVIGLFAGIAAAVLAFSGFQVMSGAIGDITRDSDAIYEQRQACVKANAGKPYAEQVELCYND